VYSATEQYSAVHSADAPTVHILWEYNEPHPFLVKSNWEPPVQQYVALESYLERVKSNSQLQYTLQSQKKNLHPAEHKALRDLKNNTKINTRKADKGTTSLFISLADKKNEEQIQLDNMENYRPLAEPTVEQTSRKVQELLFTVLYNEHHIDQMTKNGFVKHQTRLEFQYFMPLWNPQTDSGWETYIFGSFRSNREVIRLC